MPQENVLARYKILHELGRGAISAVYAARDRKSGGVVALKRLDPASNKSDAKFAERFLNEARAAARLTHPNIAKIHEAGEAAGTAYVAMEMLEGENLRTLLDAGPLQVARAIQIAHDVASGLAHAHLQGVVHGGIKPSNVILLPDGGAKLTDFGIGKLEQATVRAGVRPGALAYLSPEQLRGEAIDHRSDIFSLGALFYEMLTHRPPFQGESPKQLLENVLRAPPPLPSELNEHVPRSLDTLVLSMLAGKPVDRMPGVPVLINELERLEEGLGLASDAGAVREEPKASEPPVPPIPPEPPPQAEFREEPRFRVPPLSPAEEFPHRERITDREVFDFHKAMVMMQREPRPERAPRSSTPAIFAGLALVLALISLGLTAFMALNGPGSMGLTRLAGLAGLTGFVDPSPAPIGAPPATAPAAAAPAAGPAPVAPAPVAPPPVAAAPTQPVTPPAAPQASPLPPPQASPPPSPQASAPSESPAAPSAAPALRLPRLKQPAAKAPEQQQAQPAGRAQLILAVSPRGEIYIDGEHQGTTPPLTTFDLSPGLHRIEVRSGTRRPYLTYMMVQPGDVRRIQHDFNAKPVFPPPPG
jgi:serine/threonine protein kinase